MKRVWHIVYLSYESKLNGRSYIGKHTTNQLHDGYLGSFKDTGFLPDSRIILGYFLSEESALQAEAQWQKVFQVAPDPHFANQAYQTSEKFSYDWKGRKRTEENKKNQRKAQQRPEVREKKSKALRGRSLPLEQIQKIKESNLRTHQNPEVIAKKSRASKEVHSRPEVLEAYSKKMKGRRWWVNKEGKRMKAFKKPEGEWQQSTKWVDPEVR